MKRSLNRSSNLLAVCAGLCLIASPLALAQQGSQPQSPAQQTIDQTKDAAKRAADGVKTTVQDAQKNATDKMQQGMPGMDPKQMEMMMKSMTPNEHHTQLLQFVGEWDVKMKTWMVPGQPAEESTATATAKSEFGGRFVVMHFSGSISGQPFEGRAVTGYNNNSKQNESVWFDSMSTGMWVSTGNASSDGKTFTMTSTSTEPDGSKKKTREVTTFKSPDQYVSEFFETGADGKENKTMELTYTRKGKAGSTMKPAGSSGEPSK